MHTGGFCCSKDAHDKHGDKHNLPPYWMLVNVTDFGMVVTLYKGSPVPVRQQISGDLGISPKFWIPGS